MGFDVEVTVGSARDLKNVNWRHGDLKPYVVVWINEDGPKCSTRVGDGENPDWDDDKVVVPVNRLDEDAVLYIDVVHAAAGDDEEDVKKPLVGSARLPLREVIDDVGVGGNRASRTLRLKRPSGRPQGRLDVRVAVREANPYPSPYPAPYGQAGSRDASSYYGYGQPGPYAAPPAGYPAATAAAPGGYGYGAPPTQQAYSTAAPAVVDPNNNSEQNKTSGGKGNNKMGTGLAVGAAAGVLGGLALAGGASYLENKFDERVDDQLAAGDDDDY